MKVATIGHTSSRAYGLSNHAAASGGAKSRLYFTDQETARQTASDRDARRAARLPLLAPVPPLAKALAAAGLGA